MNEKVFRRVLGLVICTIRERSDMTAKQLGAKAGLSVSFLSDVENGKRGVSAYNLAKIAHVLGVKPGRLMPELDGPPF